MHEPHAAAPEKSRAPGSSPGQALVGWRLLALLYDLWPALALWMLAGTAFTLGYTVSGHEMRQNIVPFSALQLLLWIVCWLLTGAYAVLSWRKGGQTLGMRPWRLRVTDLHGNPARLRALCLRYAVGTLSLLLGGVGFWWAWIDRERLTWHDRISGTLMIREAKTSPLK